MSIVGYYGMMDSDVGFNMQSNARGIVSLRRFNGVGDVAYNAYNGLDPVTDIGFVGDVPNKSELESYADSKTTRARLLYDRKSEHEFIQNTHIHRPDVTNSSGIELTQNTEPYALFKGDQYLDNSSSLVFSNSFSWFLVFMPTDISVTGVLFSKGAALTTVQGISFVYTSTGTLFYVNGSTLKNRVVGDALTVNTPYIAECHGDGTTFEPFINGVSQGTNSYGGNVSSSFPFLIGARPVAPSHDSLLAANMRFFGLFVFAKTELGQRELIYNYLKSVYGSVF